MTIYPLYITPSYKPKQIELDQLVNQLPTPFLLVVDCNAHSELCICKKIDPTGHREKLLITFDQNLLNDKSYNYLHSTSGSMQAIGLSICSP